MWLKEQWSLTLITSVTTIITTNKNNFSLFINREDSEGPKL